MHRDGFWEREYKQTDERRARYGYPATLGRPRIAAAIFGWFCLLGTALSAANSNEMEEILAIVAYLQKEVSSLRVEVAELKAGKENAARSSENQSRYTSNAGHKVQSSSKPSNFPIPSSAGSRKSLEWYGYVKADAFHDSATTSHQEIPLWTLPGSEGEGETDFTARQSRFGFKIKNPGDVMGGTLTGRLEMDFFGKVNRPGDVNQNHGYQLRSRHMYLKWSNDDWDLLAGKTSQIYDVVSPDTLNFGYLNFQGRIGHRRMQFQGTRRFELGGERKLSVTAALEEPVGGVHGGDLDGNGKDDATDSEMPGFASRIRYGFNGIGGRKTYLSLANLYGREEVFGKSYDTYATVLGGSIPVTDWLKINGSIWSGTNLDGSRGGVGQGINVAKEKSIDASGGWVQFRIQPKSNYWFNIGYSIDNPDDSDLNSGQRSQNETFLLNGYYKLAEKMIVGLEYFQVGTGYKDAATATNHRIQSSFIYKF